MIGEMRDRVTAFRILKSDNGRGGWFSEEVALGTFWAQIIDLSARNIIQFRQAEMKTNTEIRMRSNTKIDRNTIFYARGKKYEIEEIIEKDHFLIISAVGENIG